MELITLEMKSLTTFTPVNDPFLQRIPLNIVLLLENHVTNFKGKKFYAFLRSNKFANIPDE